jgi:hypothetical protein
MKLLLNGKKRKIYFRKDNTPYYKSNGIENDITKYFKKTGGLKKKYINLLIENNINKKLIVGGEHTTSFESKLIFNPISIRKSLKNKDSSASRMWDSDTIKDIYTKLLYIFLICKIHYTINGKLFSERDTIYPNKTKKIKTIIDIVNGNYFYILINDPKINVSTNFETIKSSCGKNLYKFQIKGDYIFNINVGEANYTKTDDVYENILTQVSIRDIIIKINLIQLFELTQNPNTSSNYKDAILQDRKISKNTNLDILKVIMISQGLFKNLDINLTLDEIQSNDPEYCNRIKYLKDEKRKYLEIFTQKDIKSVTAEFKVLYPNFILEYNNELKLYNEYNTLWEETLKDKSTDNNYDVSKSNALLYTSSYNKYKVERILNKTNQLNKLVTFRDKINSTHDNKINKKIKTTALLKITDLITTYFNDDFLSNIYNDLIDYYINQIEETIGTKLTTYLSIRNKNISLSRVHKTSTPKKPKKTDINFYSVGGNDESSETYTGFSGVFGTFDNTNLSSVYNNMDKFNEMKPLFDGLINDNSAVLIFGYGYSGSGKTYTLFGGSNFDNDTPVYEEGITQLAINYFKTDKGATITIKAIYELYNDKYNIINAVSGTENPYKPFITRKDFLEFRPNIELDKYTATYYDIDYETPIINKYKEYEKQTKNAMEVNRGRPSTATARVIPIAPKETLTHKKNDHITKYNPIAESIYVYNYTDDKINCDGPISYDAFSKIPSNSFSHINLDDFKSLYDKIEAYRKKINHIMPTANNPSSSRGHLFIDFEIVKDNIRSYLTICDMGGRENPNDLLLATKIYNMINSIRGVDKNLLVNEPHIISKDETEMYNYNIKKLSDVKKPLNDTMTSILTELENEHNGSVRHDKYPGILQLYKSFYSTPTIIDYFYQDQYLNYYTYQPILFKGMDEKSKSLPAERALSKMTIDQSNGLLINFYKLFFKCIKQGFYINDSINQLLNKFQADPQQIATEEIRYIKNTDNDRKCILESLSEMIYKNDTGITEFDRERFNKARAGFNRYGWYTNSLPEECITDTSIGNAPKIFLNLDSSKAKPISKPYELTAKIYKNSYFQYNPNKITPASDITEDNLAIGRIYDTFGTLNSGSDIPRKYVVIGCVRDTDKFVDDDKKTLNFLHTVSSSRLTDNS